MNRETINDSLISSYEVDRSVPILYIHRMKTICVAFIVVLLQASFVFSDAISWTTDLKKGLKEARDSEKVAMIDVYTDWCTWCKELDSKTYKDPKVIKLSKSFVNIKVNPEKDKFVAEFVKKYEVTGFPTILFIEHTGALLVRVGGFLPGEGFAKKMEEAPKILARLKTYSGEFKKGEYSNSAEYLNMLVELSRMDEAFPVFEAVKKSDKVDKSKLSDAYIRLGLFFAMAEKLETAKPYFIEAATLFPGTENGYAAIYYHAYTEFLLGKTDVAIRIVEKALKGAKLPVRWKNEYNGALGAFKQKKAR